jgi:hypothetical protein
VRDIFSGKVHQAYCDGTNCTKIFNSGLNECELANTDEFPLSCNSIEPNLSKKVLRSFTADLPFRRLEAGSRLSLT